MKFQKLTHSQKKVGAVVFALAAGVSVLFAVQLMNVHPLVVTDSGVTPIARAELPPSESLASEVKSQQNSKTVPVNAVPFNRAFNHSSEAPARLSWQMADIKAGTPLIPLSEKISDFTVVELPEKVASVPGLGEQISMPLLQGKNYVASVESVSNLSNGDYSWSGHLEGYGTDYPVVMTYGEHSAFATITTPEGSYTMESVDGLGWLYKNPAEIELSHPAAKDFLEIDEKP